MKKCPACGGPNLTDYKTINGYLLKKCINCTLLITITSKKKWDNYVKKKYSKEYAFDYSSALPRLKKRYEHQLALLMKYKENGKLLDVGCGTGHFLQFIKKSNTRLKTYGIEPNSILRNAAKKNSDSIISNGYLNNIPYPEKYFDIITCFDVLEHSIDLKANLRDIYRVLKPNGILLLQAPNYDSFMAMITRNKWDWWCIPDHVIHFSYRGLRECINSSNFRIRLSYTYEDTEDFFKNIKGLFRNKLYKVFYFLLRPFLGIMEFIGSKSNHGAISVVLAQKD